MNRNLVLNKGLDLKITGAVESSGQIVGVNPSSVAVCPDDFPGLLPKLEVKEGDQVIAGQPLLRDKINEAIKIVSPASGKVVQVVRGERRKIERVVVAVENQDQKPTAIPGSDAKNISEAIQASGLWVMMRQRPYDIIPDPKKTPRDIFVTAFDSSPLAPDLSLYIKGKDNAIETGVKALKSLTSGEVYISTTENYPVNIPETAVHVTIKGDHPAGNPGIQAANIAPVSKGETIWTLDIVTLAKIGQLVTEGTYDFSTLVALTGSEIEHPHYVSTLAGADIADLLKGSLKTSDHHIRIISGNVLTGVTVPADGYLRFPYRHLTVIPEGDDVNEFMGWASVSPRKMSVSRSFPSHFLFGRRFAPDARLNGGRRAMIMSGEYDKVLPMDILPEYLIKAILSRDIDKMESLGIYEVAPEDFALCEYVDPSKLELQKIVREGLDYLRKELD